MGYGKWFIAGYPDVVKYFSNLEEEDEEVATIFGNTSEENLVDNEDMIKLEYLRKMVDAFKNKGNKLECSLK